MTSALEGGEWSAARPGRTLPTGKTRYPFYRRLGGPQGRSGRAENLVPTGIRSRIIHPVVTVLTELPGPHMIIYVYKQMRNSDIYYSVIGDICEQISVLCRNLMFF